MGEEEFLKIADDIDNKLCKNCEINSGCDQIRDYCIKRYFEILDNI